MQINKNNSKNDQDSREAKSRKCLTQSTSDIKKCFHLDLKIQKLQEFRYSKNYKLLAKKAIIEAENNDLTSMQTAYGDLRDCFVYLNMSLETARRSVFFTWYRSPRA